MSLVVIDCSREARSPWTARLSLYQISISAGSQAVIQAQQHTAVAQETQGHGPQNREQEHYKARLTYGAAQPGWERIVSSPFIWAVTTNCICLMIKCFAVENRKPLMVKLKHSFVCVCVKNVCVQAWGIFWRRDVRFALDETPALVPR